MTRQLTGWLIQNPPQNNQTYINSRQSICDDMIESAEKHDVLMEYKSLVDLNVLCSKIMFNQEDRGLLPDFVNLWSKDIVLIKILENLGVRCFNSSQSIEISGDKAVTSTILAKHNLAQPKFVSTPRLVENDDWIEYSFVDDAIDFLKLPIVGKKCKGSFGEEVSKLNTRQDVIDFLQSYRHDEYTVLQEFIPESSGRDVRCYVVGDKVVAAMERNAASKSEFRANIAAGGFAKPYIPTQEDCQLAIAATKALGLDYAGVDLLFGPNGPLVCEVNSNAHFKGINSVSDCKIQDEIIEYIMFSMKD